MNELFLAIKHLENAVADIACVLSCVPECTKQDSRGILNELNACVENIETIDAALKKAKREAKRASLEE